MSFGTASTPESEMVMALPWTSLAAAPFARMISLSTVKLTAALTLPPVPAGAEKLPSALRYCVLVPPEAGTRPLSEEVKTLGMVVS